MPDIYLVDRDVIYFADGWTWQGDGYQEKFHLPHYFDVGESEPLVIRNTIPEDLPHGAHIAIKSYMQSVIIKIDGETIYAAGHDSDKFLGRDFASFWAVADIAPEYKGKTVELTLFSHLSSSKGYASEPVIASGTGVLGHIFIQKGFIGNILPPLIIILGIVLIIGSIMGRIHKENRRALLYLGFTAVILGNWFLGDTGMLQLVTKNTYFTTRITFLMTLLSIIPFGLYIRETIPMKKKRFLGDFLISLTIINATVCLILEYFDILGIRDTLPAAALLIAAFCVYNMIILPIEALYYKNAEASRELKGLLIYMVFGIMETVKFYSGGQKGSSHYILIGAIIYISISVFNQFNEYNKREKTRKEKEYFEKMAYTDALTGGFNRAGYTRDLNDIINPEGLVVVQADIDRLKYINDYFGHSHGDRAIIDTYEVLNKNFAKVGKVYRIGGDEFSAIIKNTDMDEINRIIEQVKEEADLIAEERPYDFSVSFGTVEYDSSLDKDISATIVRADHKMYDDKKRLRGSVPRKMPAV